MRIGSAFALVRNLASRGLRLGGQMRVAMGRLAGRGKPAASPEKDASRPVNARWLALSRQLRRYLHPEGANTPGAMRALPPPLPRAPEGRRIYAIGDIHGRADLLGQLLKTIEKDAMGGSHTGKAVLIFLGDYVDRGFQSRDVIDLLLGESLSQFETYFLKGNHEAALLQFLQDPSIGPRWAEFGGTETLASYGVRPPRSRTAADDWARASQDLNRALPPEHLRFLLSLQLSVRMGDYLFVHAGVKPGVDLERQSEYDLLWIRDEFLNDRRRLGAVVVHGHTPTPYPHQDHRRVGIDTGAYISGRLTAARFEHESIAFFSTGASQTASSPRLVTGEAG